MAETFVSANLILPGTYIRVRSEGLIGVRGISAGNIGVVGAATTGVGTTETLSTLPEAEEAFGPPVVDGAAASLNLTAQIGELYRNGARTIFARAVNPGGNQADYDWS